MTNFYQKLIGILGLQGGKVAGQATHGNADYNTTGKMYQPMKVGEGAKVTTGGIDGSGSPAGNKVGAGDETSGQNI